MTSREDLQQWLLEYIDEAEAVQERLAEHRAELERLERLEAAQGDGSDPVVAKLNRRHGIILKKLESLAATGSPQAWRSAAGVARKRIQQWASGHADRFPDDTDGLRRAMARRRKALGRGRTLAGALPKIEKDLSDELELIAQERTNPDPREGISALVEVDDDLKQLRLQIDSIRSSLLGLARRIEEPIFAALLGRTSSLRKQAGDGLKALKAARAVLRLSVEEEGVREKLKTLDGQIHRELSQLPLKADAHAWLKDSAYIQGLVDEWGRLNAGLKPPEDGSRHLATKALLAANAKAVEQSGGFEAELRALEGQLKAIPDASTDTDTVTKIRAAAEALEATLLQLRGQLDGASNTYHGPNLFQGIANAIGAVESEAISFLYEAESREREAEREALAALDETALRAELESMLAEIRKAHIETLGAETDPAAWSHLSSRAERALRHWLSMAEDLEPPAGGEATVRKVLGLIATAQELVKTVGSLEMEFERRRTIEFAQAEADEQQMLVLRTAFQRLRDQLEPESKTLSGLHSQALSAGSGWGIFAALEADVRDRLARLIDFEDRLYRMIYDMESGDPDQKTTSQGGTLNLTPEEEDAVKQLVARRVESYLEEQNRLRRLDGQPKLEEKDVPEEVISEFERFARRMIHDRTNKHG